MVKISGLMTIFPLAAGLMYAQADSAQSGTTPGPTNMQAAGSTAGAAKTSAPGAVVITSWKGTLVDANCAKGSGASKTGSSSAPAGDQNTASGQGAAVDTGRPEKHRGRKAAADSQSCPATNSTSVFALKTSEGRVLQFDDVGNARAAAALKNNAKWSKELADGGQIRAKVSGTMAGDNVTVTSID